MKKITLIATVSGIVLLVLLTWGYLFLYGTPKAAEDIFATFGIVGGNRDTDFTDSTLIDTNGIETGGSEQTLRQLTTKPVVGMVFTDDDTALYVERGTGHIYSISISSGVETQITNTTHTKIISAKFSTSGNRVIYATEDVGGVRTSIGTITKNDTGEEVLQSLNLPFGAYNAEFASSGTEVYYLRPTTNGAEAHAYSATDQSDKLLFTVPFKEAYAAWGTPTYIYTKPSGSLLGYVYEVSGGTLRYVRSGGFGLTAFGYDAGVITTEVIDGSVRSYAYSDETRQLPLEIFPEKCVNIRNATSTLLCASPLALSLGGVYPDGWYKGITSFEDSLWQVDIQRQEATFLTDPLISTGRAMDVADIVSNEDDTQFLLINKNDNTLWLFEPSF